MSVGQHFINKTKTDNECVPDNIVNEIIKFNSSVTLKSYTKLLNQIIKYAVIPQCETVREIIYYANLQITNLMTTVT
jgi:hypothetical protein